MRTKLSMPLTYLLLSLLTVLFVIVACDSRDAEQISYTLTNFKAVPDTIYNDNNLTISSVSVKVLDNNGFPAQDIPVQFRTDFGAINATATSDSAGIARVQFKDNGDLPAGMNSKVANISVHQGNNSQSLNVTVLEEPDSYDLTNMTATPDTIYNDNNITTSEIRVLVKTNDGFPVPGAQLQFMATRGIVPASAVTDSFGIGKAEFRDNGDGLPDTLVTSTISCHMGENSVSTNVTIAPAPDIESITMTMNSTTMMIDNTMLVNARVRQTDGNFVGDGTLVRFDTDLGTFIDINGADLGPTEIVETANGLAQVRFNSGWQKGAAIVTAMVGGVTTSEEITINPGAAANIELIPDSTSIPANSNNEIRVVTTVRDRYMNTVLPGTSVSYRSYDASDLDENPLGWITPSATTNEEGVAIARFSPGQTAGTAQIEAIADSALATTALTVTSLHVSYIEFSTVQPIIINVAETGGQTSAIIRVNLYDQSGNLIDYPDSVWFSFASPPPSDPSDPNFIPANINGEVENPGEWTSVVAVNGLAMASINAGSVSGTVSIKARTFNPDGTEISATKTNISIVSGPPANIDLGIGEYNSGDQYGSGMWRVGVSATITDQWGNPVLYGTSANFSVDDSNGQNYDWVQINGSGYVGNTSVDGDSLPGVAFSYVVYDGTHTFDEVPFMVEAGDISASENLKLPLNEPELHLIPTPGHLDFINGVTMVTANITATVADNQGNPIRNAIIVFNAERGVFMPPAVEHQVEGLTYMTNPPPGVEVHNHILRTAHWTNPTSGMVTGRCIALLQFENYECPPPPQPGIPGEQNVQITAYILGTDINDNCNVILLRYE